MEDEGRKAGLARCGRGRCGSEFGGGGQSAVFATFVTDQGGKWRDG